MRKSGTSVILKFLVVTAYLMSDTPTTVIVIGGLGSVGTGIVSSFISAKQHVSIISRRSLSSLSPEQLSDNNLVSYFSCDVTNHDQLSRTLDKISSSCKVTALVNSASYRPSIHSISPTIDTWSDSILTNSLLLHVPSEIITDYFRLFSITGSVVYLSSIYGLVAPRFSIYSGTNYTTEPDYAYNKAALLGYSRYMASLNGVYGIRYNVVCPGGVENGQSQRFVSNYQQNVPLGRLATPLEVGYTVRFLCSQDASYITGSVIPVDGGWTSL
jgi:NAD(P)-dependent dehydrogenase (short-subunit alcohol dehydrogenase family)